MANQLISCDDHMDLGQLPADLWLTRLPAELRERGYASSSISTTCLMLTQGMSI